MFSLGRFTQRVRALKRTSWRNDGERSSLPKNRHFSTDTLGSSFSKRSKPPSWLLAASVFTAAGMGGWTLFSNNDSSNRYNSKADIAKETYLSCIGDDIAMPLPEADCPITFLPEVPPPIKRDYAARLRVDMETSLRTVPMDSMHNYEIWSFNGGAPGPFIRARQGDVLDISFTNNDDSGMWHNIDFHSVSGPGGGAGVLTVEPKETRSGQFKLLYPGLFIYHCAVHPVAHHVANGMYGMMLVEPEEGLPEVDREYGVLQSEFYLNEEPDEPGSNVYGMDADRLLAEDPNYVVLNGRVGALTTDDGEPLKCNAGERVRLFVGNAGPNLVSSFHVIGGIFDKVYREGDLITPPARGLQTTLIPAGGASVVELVPTTPGVLTMVDHSIVRIEKGCVGFIDVEGPICPKVFHSDREARPCQPCKIHP